MTLRPALKRWGLDRWHIERIEPQAGMVPIVPVVPREIELRIRRDEAAGRHEGW
jgi:hypothetical protein